MANPKAPLGPPRSTIPWLCGSLVLGLLIAADASQVRAQPTRGTLTKVIKIKSLAPVATPAAPAPVETRFVQVHPAPAEDGKFKRSPSQEQAVVLLQGLHVHPFSSASVLKPEFRGWQQAGSKLVETLSSSADVFAFAYGQNVAVEEIAGVPGLGDNIRRLRELGYTRVVLIGHSAGGLIARQFVEDHPNAGVTKVIQVCSPNGGCAMARFDTGVRKDQRSFLNSLTKESRAAFLKGRPDKKIPASVQFVCVVGEGAGMGDYLVSNESQWPGDLQAQGIPAIALKTTHFTVMRSKTDAQKLAEILNQNQPRWDAAKVAVARKDLHGNSSHQGQP